MRMWIAVLCSVLCGACITVNNNFPGGDTESPSGNTDGSAVDDAVSRDISGGVSDDMAAGADVGPDVLEPVCTYDSDCPVPACDESEGLVAWRCVDVDGEKACERESVGCAEDTPLCVPSLGGAFCVECTDDEHCAPDVQDGSVHVCQDNNCVETVAPLPTCSVVEDCPANADEKWYTSPVCMDHPDYYLDDDTKVCVEPVDGVSGGGLGWICHSGQDALVDVFWDSADDPKTAYPAKHYETYTPSYYDGATKVLLYFVTSTGGSKPVPGGCSCIDAFGLPRPVTVVTSDTSQNEHGVCEQK